MRAKRHRSKSSRAIQAVTINDVAECAGVSPMTVSRVVSGQASVSAAAQEEGLACEQSRLGVAIAKEGQRGKRGPTVGP